jgi:hypothetical protein
MAHGLLNSVAIIGGAAHTLQESWTSLPVDERDRLLRMISEQAAHVAAMLGELARGLPVGVLQELEALSEGHHPR